MTGERHDYPERDGIGRHDQVGNPRMPDRMKRAMEAEPSEEGLELLVQVGLRHRRLGREDAILRFEPGASPLQHRPDRGGQLDLLPSPRLARRLLEDNDSSVEVHLAAPERPSLGEGPGEGPVAERLWSIGAKAMGKALVKQDWRTLSKAQKRGWSAVAREVRRMVGMRRSGDTTGDLTMDLRKGGRDGRDSHATL